MPDLSEAGYQRQLLLRSRLLQKELGKLHLCGHFPDGESNIDRTQATHKVMHKRQNGSHYAPIIHGFVL